MTLSLALILFSSFTASSEEEEARWSINAARVALREGRISDAMDALTPWVGREDVFGRLSRFGMANAFVLQADLSDTHRAPSEAALRQAIEFYRELLSGEGELPSRDDVSHNLLVAKAMLARILKSEGNRTSPTEVNRQEESPNGQGEPGDPIPSEKVDSKPAESSVHNEVRQATPGIGDRDPGPLTPQAAAKLLSDAMNRLAKPRNPSPAASPPRSARDF